MIRNCIEMVLECFHGNKQQNNIVENPTEYDLNSDQEIVENIEVPKTNNTPLNNTKIKTTEPSYQITQNTSLNNTRIKSINELSYITNKEISSNNVSSDAAEILKNISETIEEDSVVIQEVFECLPIEEYSEKSKIQFIEKYLNDTLYKLVNCKISTSYKSFKQFQNTWFNKKFYETFTLLGNGTGFVLRNDYETKAIDNKEDINNPRDILFILVLLSSNGQTHILQQNMIDIKFFLNTVNNVLQGKNMGTGMNLDFKLTIDKETFDDHPAFHELHIQRAPLIIEALNKLTRKNYDQSNDRKYIDLFINIKNSPNDSFVDKVNDINFIFNTGTSTLFTYYTPVDLINKNHKLQKAINALFKETHSTKKSDSKFFEGSQWYILRFYMIKNSLFVLVSANEQKLEIFSSYASATHVQSINFLNSLSIKVLKHVMSEVISEYYSFECLNANDFSFNSKYRRFENKDNPAIECKCLENIDTLVPILTSNDKEKSIYTILMSQDS